MPTYQYRCPNCGEVFEHVEHVAEHETAQLRCPKCGGETIQHQPTHSLLRRRRGVRWVGGRQFHQLPKRNR